MRKRYSRSYTVLSFLTMFSYRELPFECRFFIYAIRDHGLRESHKTRVLILVHSTKAQNIIKNIVLF